VYTKKRLKRACRCLVLVATLSTAASCGNGAHDIEIAGSLLRDAGDNQADLKVAAGQLEQYRNLKNTSSALRSASEGLGSSEVLARLHEKLVNFQEQTDGPVRAAIIETACDSAIDGQTTPDQIQSNLERHLAAKLGPREVGAIGAAEEAAANLRDALNSGSSGQASVVLICYAADTAS
jgi:hypothetical protein